MWLRALALLLAAGAAAALLASGPAYRLGALGLGEAVALMRWAVYLGAGAAALAALGLALPRVRRGGVVLLAGALALGAASAAVPLELLRRARSVPPIHDISTDVESPPAFAAIVPLRAGAPNPPEYAGPETARAQGEAYPDLAPLVLPLAPAQAFERAAAAAARLGWEIVAREPAAGRLEATDTTWWFGFKDDIVVRVVPAGDGASRIDVRSKSRVGRSDLGTNARRIRAFQAALRD